MESITNIKEDILNIINSNVENINLQLEQTDEDLSELGMNSVSFISVVVAIERYFEIEYPDEYLLISQSNTLSVLTNIISEVIKKKNQR